MKRRISALLVCTLLASLAVAWANKHRHHRTPAGSGNFDYYLLALSWAPSYCASHPTDHSNECRTGNHTAFVLHGLWPQANSGPPPMSCAPASPVAHAIVDHMLQFMPTRSLIQHEWAEHGTCSGLSAQDYFNRVEQAFKSVQVPDQYRSLDHEQEVGVTDLEQNFADANHAPREAFRTSCHAGELVNLEVCLSKDLHYQACSASARECPANQVEMGPTR